MNTKTLLILLGVTGVAFLGAVLLSDNENAPRRDDQLGRRRNAVRRHLMIAPDCSSIELVGDQDEYEDDLGQLFELVLPAAQAQGLETPDELAEFMLVQILPECVIPPAGGFEERPDLSLLFLNMRGRIVEALEQTELPDVDDDASTFDGKNTTLDERAPLQAHLEET